MIYGPQRSINYARFGLAFCLSPKCNFFQKVVFWAQPKAFFCPLFYLCTFWASKSPNKRTLGVVPINNPQNPPLFKLSCKLDLLIKLLQLSHPCSSSISFISMASACSKTTSLPPKRGQIKAQIFRIFVNAIVFVALKVVEAARSITNSQSNEVEAKVEENSASTPLLLL